MAYTAYDGRLEDLEPLTSEGSLSASEEKAVPPGPVTPTPYEGDPTALEPLGVGTGSPTAAPAAPGVISSAMGAISDSASAAGDWLKEQFTTPEPAPELQPAHLQDASAELQPAHEVQQFSADHPPIDNTEQAKVPTGTEFLLAPEVEPNYVEKPTPKGVGPMGAPDHRVLGIDAAPNEEVRAKGWDLAKAGISGLATSKTGLSIKAAMEPGSGMPEDYQPHSKMAKILKLGATALADVPAMIAGSTIGAALGGLVGIETGPGAALTAGAGGAALAFALPGAMGETATQILKDGKVTDPLKIAETAVKEGGIGALTGLIVNQALLKSLTPEAKALYQIAIQSGGKQAALSFLNKAGLIDKVAEKLVIPVTEVLTFTAASTVQKVADGEPVPSMEEFNHSIFINIATMWGLHLATAASNKILGTVAPRSDHQVFGQGTLAEEAEGLHPLDKTLTPTERTVYELQDRLNNPTKPIEEGTQKVADTFQEIDKATTADEAVAAALKAAGVNTPPGEAPAISDLEAKNAEINARIDATMKNTRAPETPLEGDLNYAWGQDQETLQANENAKLENKQTVDQEQASRDYVQQKNARVPGWANAGTEVAATPQTMLHDLQMKRNAATIDRTLAQDELANTDQAAKTDEATQTVADLQKKEADLQSAITKMSVGIAKARKAAEPAKTVSAMEDARAEQKTELQNVYKARRQAEATAEAERAKTTVAEKATVPPPEEATATEAAIVPEEAVATEAATVPEEAVATEAATVPKEATATEAATVPEEATATEAATVPEEAIAPTETPVIPGTKIGPKEMVNGITRAAAGDMMKEGDEAVLSHIREGIQAHGILAMEDAIRNQQLYEVASSDKTERATIRENMRRLEPQINQVFDDARAKDMALPEGEVAPQGAPDFTPNQKLALDNLRIAADAHNAKATQVGGKGAKFVNELSEIPATLRKEIPDDGRTDGVFDPLTGQVYVILGNMARAGNTDIQRVIAHEIIGHYGVEAILKKGGYSLGRFADDIDRLRSSDSRINDAATAIERIYADDAGKLPDRITIAKEIMAHMAENGVKHTVLERVAYAVRNGLRKLGVDLTKFGVDLRINQTDLKGILDSAKKVAERTNIEGDAWRGKRGDGWANVELPSAVKDNVINAVSEGDPAATMVSRSMREKPIADKKLMDFFMRGVEFGPEELEALKKEGKNAIKIATFQKAQKAFAEFEQFLGTAHADYLAQIKEGIDAYPEMKVAPIPKNADPSYVKTIDLVGACVRMLRAMTIHKYVRANGIEPSPEQFRAIEIALNAKGFDLTCMYCYAFTRRATGIAKLELTRDLLLKGEVPEVWGWGKGEPIKAKDQALWRAAIREAGNKPDWLTEWKKVPDMMAIKTVADKRLASQDTDANNFKENFPAIFALKQVTTGMGSAMRLPGMDIAMAGQIVGLPKAEIAGMMKWGGLRWQSSVDFVPAFTYDYVQGIGEMHLAQVAGHVYTKEIDLVRLFAKNGMKLNLSAAPMMDKGKIIFDKTRDIPVLDKAIGSIGIDEVDEALRIAPDHAGVMMLVLNDEVFDWMVTSKSKYASYGIPWHASGMPTAIKEQFIGVLGAKDYTDTHESVKSYKNMQDIPDHLRPLGIDQIGTNGEATGKKVVDYSRIGEVIPELTWMQDVYKDATDGLHRPKKNSNLATPTSVILTPGDLINQAKGIGDAEATKIYFDVCKQLDIKPVFADSYLAGYRERNGGADPEFYWRVKKHYARTDTPLLPPDPRLTNYEYAKALDTAWQKAPLSQLIREGKGTIMDALKNAPLSDADKQAVDEATTRIMSLVSPEGITDLRVKAPSVKRLLEETRNPMQTALTDSRGTEQIAARPRYEGGHVQEALPENKPSLFRRSKFGDITPEQEQALKNVGGITHATPLRDWWTETRNQFAVKLTQSVADQYKALTKLSPEAYMQARMAAGQDGALEAMMYFGDLFLSDGVPDVKVGVVRPIIKALQSLQGEQHRFLWWVAANRAERLSGEERENLFQGNDIAALKKLNQGAMPHGKDRATVYAEVLKDYVRTNKNVMDIAEQSGSIDGETRKAWEHDMYVPFFRASEDKPGAPGPHSSGGLVRQYAFKQLKGGTSKLNNDLLANTMMNWAHILDASAKNRAADVSLRTAEQIGVATYVGENPKGKNNVYYMGRFDKVLPAGQKYTENGVDKVANGTDAVSLWGKKYYQVNDPLILEAISALDFSGYKGPAMKVMGAFMRYLTVGVTANPAFKVRNLIRDSLTTPALAGASYNPLKNIAQGTAIMTMKGQDYASVLAGGGLIRFGAMLDGSDASRTDKLINSGVKGASILDTKEKLMDFATKAFDVYNEIGDISEGANRAALYKQRRAEGATHAQASFEARDLMDFHLKGAGAATRFLMQTVPFFNARIQGLYKLGRAGQADPKRLGAVLGATAMASIALMLAYKDDEDWKARQDWDRDNYFWFKIGDKAFRIPKGFEVGVVATLAERGSEMLVSSEMTGKRMADRVAFALGQTLSFNPVPQLIKPALDIYADTNSFTGSPIEGYMSNRLKEDRYNYGTSNAAKVISAKAGKFVGLSPVQIDSLIRGYFGWLGTSTTTAIDAMTHATKNKPTMKLRDVFLAGNFVESLPSNVSSRYVTDFYNQSKEVQEAYNSYNAKVKEGDISSARSMIVKNPGLVADAEVASRFENTLRQLHSVSQSIQNNKKFTPEEKRQKLDDIAAKINLVAKKAQGLQAHPEPAMD